MQQLSELDASFLYLETDSTPMHLGGIYLFDGSDSETALDFETFKQVLSSRLHVAPFFRQRLFEVPLRLDRPYWIDDAQFDLDKHVRHITLANQRDSEELISLSETLLQRPLSRDRPLWEITFVDGFDEHALPANSFALVVKIHHAAIDAFSGEEIMGILLEYSSTPKRIAPSQAWTPRPLPSRLRLLTQAYANALQKPFRLASLARDAAAAVLHTLLLQRIRELNLPLALFNAPRSPLNHNISGRRQLVSKTVSLARLKAIRNQLGEVTLNDVVLGVCAETLVRYLQARDALPDTALVALTPVSVRSKTLRSPTGNQMSALMLSLATQEPDPAKRIRLIHRNAVISEHYQQAIAANRLTELLPSTLLALSARLYSEFQLAQRHTPLFNLPITNVPGPKVPLYLQGARLVRQINSSPLFDGMGVVILAVSYLGDMTFNFTLCPDVIQDGAQFADLLDESVAAIEIAAQQLEMDAAPLTEEESVPNSIDGALIDEVVGYIESMIGTVLKRFRSERREPESTPSTDSHS